MHRAAQEPLETVSRIDPVSAVARSLEQVPFTPPVAPLGAPAPKGFALVDYSVTVPKALSVSEANLYYPIADIVWRGDPYGNRKEQIAKLFQNALVTEEQRAAGYAAGAREVKAEIQLVRFHSVTEKTRYTVGGNHSITFYMTLTDAQTGAVVVPKHVVQADLLAYGGFRAKRAERQGLDMKTRVQAHLNRVIAAELSGVGWKDQDRRLAHALDGL
jgi:hypothetical protein